MTNLKNLKRLTRELAEEIEYDEHGKAWKFITLILDSVQSPAAIINRDNILLYINKECRDRFKKQNSNIDKYINKSIKNSEFCKPLGMDCDKCPINMTIKTREVHTTDYTSTITNTDYRMLCIPLVFDGVSGVLAILSEKNGR